MHTDTWNSTMPSNYWRRRQVVIHRVQGCGHVFRVVLKQNARAKVPDPFIFHRKKRKKRKRPPSQWFLERRHLMDAGQHEGFARIEVWSPIVLIWTRRMHNRLETELHERRRQRLEEIRKDFSLWFNTPLPETSINFSEPGQEWMEIS